MKSVILALLAAGLVVVVPQALVASADTGGPDCGGTTIYQADGTPWTCTFDDEFNGNSLDQSKWTAQLTVNSNFTTGSMGAHACYVNSPNNVSVSGGDLLLTTRREKSLVFCGVYSSVLTSGMVTSFGKFSQAYGRYEIRAEFPSTTNRGLHEALWLFPNNDSKYGTQQASGEIDIAENYSQLANLVVPYIHYAPSGADPNVTTSTGCPITLGVFHTYVLVWTKTSLTITVDGAPCVTDTWHPAAPLVAPEPFDQPFFTALTAGLGANSNSYNLLLTKLPATTYIDYVRIWK